MVVGLLASYVAVAMLAGSYAGLAAVVVLARLLLWTYFDTVLHRGVALVLPLALFLALRGAEYLLRQRSRRRARAWIDDIAQSFDPVTAFAWEVGGMDWRPALVGWLGPCLFLVVALDAVLYMARGEGYFLLL